MAREWQEEELGWAHAKLEIRCVTNRLRRRWPVVLTLAILATLLLVGHQSRKPQLYRSRVLMRVSETDFDPNSAPPTSRQLRNYLSDTALSRGVLLAVMEQYKISPKGRRQNEALALEEFRDLIRIQVHQNHFGRARRRNDPPRSARISIDYRGDDSETTLAVVRDLGDLVVSHQTTERQEAAKQTATWAGNMMSGVRDELYRTRGKEVKLRLQLRNLQAREKAAIQVQLHRLLFVIDELERRVDLFAERSGRLQLRRDFEGEAAGMRFEMVDRGRQSMPMFSKGQRLFMLGTVAFFMVFPGVTLAFGVFDTRLRDVDSLRRLGIEPFGHVPPFPGDAVGSLVGRRRAANSLSARNS